MSLYPDANRIEKVTSMEYFSSNTIFHVIFTYFTLKNCKNRYTTQNNHFSMIHILLIEDDVAITESLKLYLENSGF